MIGRFAPSPTGPLHVGNLRTALIAWLCARSAGSSFLLRIEDLDVAASRPEHVVSHERDLAAIGLDWDGAVVRQSERFELYRDVLTSLVAADLVYPCYCTRREVQAAVRAAHGPEAETTYPGTCRELTGAARRAREEAGRPAALRLRANDVELGFEDRFAGPYRGVVDDFVVQRNDGAPAYNLAVVVDDHLQGVEEVVRADDLLATTPRQLLLHRVLGWPAPSYVHVPLVLGPDGERLAKRHGAVSVSDLADAGVPVDEVRARVVASLGDGAPNEVSALLRWFELSALSHEPWVFDPATLST